MRENKKLILAGLMLLIAALLCGYIVLFNSQKQALYSGTTRNNTAQKKASQGINAKLAEQSKIKKFAGTDELIVFLEENGSQSNHGYFGERFASPMAMGVDVWGGELKDSAGVPAEKSVNSERVMGNGGESDYSRTNIQVEGVDEADIIKTDGQYIYAVAQNNLFIINAVPAEKAEIISKIEFKSRPQDIYISGNSLAVYGSDTSIGESEDYKKFKRRGDYTFFKVFDVSDKKNPKQVRDLDFEGGYSDSRMIGDYVYLITSADNYYYIEGEPVMPRILSNGNNIADCAKEAKCFKPDVYYFEMPYNSYNFTNITSINVKDNQELIKGEAYLMSNSQNIYASQNSIYITYIKYISEYQLQMEVMREMVYPKLSARDQEKISKIETADNFILSSEEKMQKIGFILESYVSSLQEDEENRLEKELEEKMKQKYKDITKELEKTVIHKIAINSGDLQYKATGEVTGQVLNQFSMDENGDNFRIATTKNQVWSQYADEERNKSSSNLYVLDENLKIIGSLEGLAKGERIYSARFMQNRAYLVTFKQTDPLFAIDLSDPASPKALGELKIPGFSNYLHPYDDTTLIGFGKDTGETEWGGVRTKGLKLTLFDVSDVNQPKEIDTYLMGDMSSDSIALNDHKAFLFSRDKNLLVVPVSISETAGEFDWSKITFSGAAVFSIDKSGIELKGKIDHSDNGRLSGSYYWNGYDYDDSTVKRSLYIGDTLFTFSDKYLKMNKINDLQEVNTLELKKEKTESESDYKVVN